MSTNLKAALGTKKLTLRSDSSNGVPYTRAEHKLALMCLVPLLAIAGTVKHENKDKDGKPHVVPNEVNEAIEVAAKDAATPSIAGIAKSAYRALVTAKIGEKADAKGTADFPKHRDQTSINLIFRTACKELKVDAAAMDQMFPHYGAKKVQSA